MKTFKHSSSERNSPQLKALINDAGIISYGIYWYFLEEINEGNGIEMNANILKSLAFVFKTSVEELNAVIECMVKHELFFKYKGKLVTEGSLENMRKRSEAGVKGAAAKWRGKMDSVVEKPKEVDKIVNEVLQKDILDLEDLKPIGEIIKNKPVARKATAKPKEIKFIEEKQEKKSFALWQFLILFNRVKLEFKPKSLGHKVLNKDEKTNFARLIALGYGEDDFEKVFRAAFSNKWVKENNFETPDHVLRNANFTRYLNQSNNSESNNLVINESDEPNFK